MDFIFKAFFLILAGMCLVRISGRQSVAQMTVTTTVVMVSIGTMIVQPIVRDGNSVWKTVVSVSIFIFTLMVIDFLRLKFNFFETVISGKAVILIQDGHLHEKNLKKHRMTVDQLEMHLRTSGISKISDVKTATLEPNGLIGYELTDDAKPLTMGDLKKLLQNGSPHKKSENDLFKEISDGHQKELKKKLQ